VYNRLTPTLTSNHCMLIDGVQVSPVTSVRNLGIFIDSDLVMRSHVQRIVSGCFDALRHLRQIRNSVPTATFQSLIGCRSGAIQTWLRKQRAGRSSYKPGTSPPVGADRTQPRAVDLQTLTLRYRCAGQLAMTASVQERVVYKIAVLTFNVKKE